MRRVTTRGLKRREWGKYPPLEVWLMPNAAHLSHVDRANSQSLVAQNRSVLVPFPPLQHDLKLVAFPLQEVRVLRLETQRKRLLRPLTLSPKLPGSRLNSIPRVNPRAFRSAYMN